MCGSSERVSEMSSMSKKTAPGIWAAANSAQGSRPLSGMCQLASRMRTSGADRCDASQSVLTRRSGSRAGIDGSSP